MSCRGVCGKILNFQLRNTLLVLVYVLNYSDDRNLDPGGWTHATQSCGKYKPTIKEPNLYNTVNKNKEHVTRDATFILHTTGSEFDERLLERKPFRTDSCYLVWVICCTQWKGKVIRKHVSKKHGGVKVSLQLFCVLVVDPSRADRCVHLEEWTAPIEWEAVGVLGNREIFCSRRESTVCLYHIRGCNATFTFSVHTIKVLSFSLCMHFLLCLNILLKIVLGTSFRWRCYITLQYCHIFWRSLILETWKVIPCRIRRLKCDTCVYIFWSNFFPPELLCSKTFWHIGSNICSLWQVFCDE